MIDNSEFYSNSTHGLVVGANDELVIANVFSPEDPPPHQPGLDLIFFIVIIVATLLLVAGFAEAIGVAVEAFDQVH